MSRPVIITVKGLTKRYKDVAVLKAIDFEVQQGTVFALLGANGAGKTTTVNILATLLRADEGSIMINGVDARKMPSRVRPYISLTGQFAAVDDLLTGRENMDMMGRLSKLNGQTIKERSAELLKRLDLEVAADRRVATYSGGMRRKLDLAISLLARPAVIFLDEPTTGLDPRSRQELWSIIKGLARNGTTIVLTTQYLEEADQLADTIAVLHEGRIVAEGTARELKQHIGNDYLELHFKGVADTQKSLGLLKGSIFQENFVTVSLQQADEIREVLDQLHAAKLRPIDISIRKPTLDDVFMKITENREEV